MSLIDPKMRTLDKARHLSGSFQSAAVIHSFESLGRSSARAVIRGELHTT
jgi:hypothetical protein